VTLSLSTHIPLHTTRYDLYFVMAAPPPRSTTLQVHVAVVDNESGDVTATRQYFASRGKPLPKFNNPILWYDPASKRWFHPQTFNLNGKELTVYLNLCIAADVPVPADQDVWSTVHKYHKA
jgi:hypothetical protein